jgi:hypothetical protein
VSIYLSALRSDGTSHISQVWLADWITSGWLIDDDVLGRI